jgi:hypothetical protein
MRSPCEKRAKLVLADARGSSALARVARRRLPAAHLQAETPEELWSKYMQLTQAEASFRALKSELSTRPLFHQKERRVKVHVMVRDGSVSGVCALGHLKTSAAAPDRILANDRDSRHAP